MSKRHKKLSIFWASAADDCQTCAICPFCRISMLAHLILTTYITDQRLIHGELEIYSGEHAHLLAQVDEYIASVPGFKNKYHMF
jgi:hypothetical protein